MKIFKRNQLIILVISLMLIISGYLNFNANIKKEITTTSNRSDAEIGDAQLVSVSPEVDNSIDLSSVESKDKIQNKLEDYNTEQDQLQESDVIEQKEDYYFTNSKLERNNMYSENLESYQEIYNNTNATAENKKEAFANINKINIIKNSIMIAENLIKAKGFEDVVIFVNEQSISVIVKNEELKQEEVAQIQNIVSRELNVEAEKIHISNKS